MIAFCELHRSRQTFFSVLPHDAPKINTPLSLFLETHSPTFNTHTLSLFFSPTQKTHTHTPLYHLSFSLTLRKHTQHTHSVYPSLTHIKHTHTFFLFLNGTHTHSSLHRHRHWVHFLCVKPGNNERLKMHWRNRLDSHTIQVVIFFLQNYPFA